MSEFKREERYIVVKLKRISDDTEAALREFLESWQVPTEQCVVVEHDWPNYEDTWVAVEQVAAGTYCQAPVHRQCPCGHEWHSSELDDNCPACSPPQEQ